MKTLRRLTSLGATFICAAAIIGTLAVMLLDRHTREVFQDEWFSYLWVIAPYAAVGAVSYLGRGNLLASIFGLVTAIFITILAIFLLLPYLLDSGNDTGKAMAAGISPIVQWQVVGVMTVIALVALGLRRLQRGLKKGR